MIHYWYGEGPNALGVGSFSPVYLLSGDVGCSVENATVETPVGVLFKSLRGWYLLTSDMQAVYVGGPVKDYDSSAPISLEVLADKRQAIILLSGSTNALVFDWGRMAWAVWNGHTAYDGAVWNNLYCWLHSSDAQVRQQTTTHLDDGAGYVFGVKTPNINIGGILGGQRVYEIQAAMQTEALNAGSIYMGYYRDGESAASETSYAAIAAMLDTQALFEPVFRPAAQKCESVAVSVYDTTTADKALKLIALAFEIGIRAGMAKRPASYTNRLGTTGGATASTTSTSAPAAPAAPATSATTATSGGK
jgi:hypothetical protein